MENPRLSINIKRVIVLMVVLVLILIGWFIFYTLGFHETRLSPSDSNINTLTSSVTIDFNRPLLKQNYPVILSPSAISSTTINKRSITINLNIPLTANKQYKITIPLVEDTNHDKLKNIVLYFTPKYVPYNKINSSQQNKLLKQQTIGTAKNQPPVLIGKSALLSNGLSSIQLVLLEQAFLEFQKNIKVINVASSSIQPGPHNPNTSSSFSLDFSVTINNEAQYNGTITYSSINSLQLNLYNPSSNTIVFSSNTLT